MAAGSEKHSEHLAAMLHQVYCLEDKQRRNDTRTMGETGASNFVDDFDFFKDHLTAFVKENWSEHLVRLEAMLSEIALIGSNEAKWTAFHAQVLNLAKLDPPLHDLLFEALRGQRRYAIHEALPDDEIRRVYHNHIVQALARLEQDYPQLVAIRPTLLHYFDKDLEAIPNIREATDAEIRDGIARASSFLGRFAPAFETYLHTANDRVLDPDEDLSYQTKGLVALHYDFDELIDMAVKHYLHVSKQTHLPADKQRCVDALKAAGPEADLSALLASFPKSRRLKKALRWAIGEADRLGPSGLRHFQETVWHPPEGVKANKVVVLCHGWRNSGTTMSELAKQLAEEGAIVHAIDARSYGMDSARRAPKVVTGVQKQDDSHGKPKVREEWLRTDCRKYVDHVAAQYPGMPMQLVGHSLGAATLLLESKGLMDTYHRASDVEAEGGDPEPAADTAHLTGITCIAPAIFYEKAHERSSQAAMMLQHKLSRDDAADAPDSAQDSSRTIIQSAEYSGGRELDSGIDVIDVGSQARDALMRHAGEFGDALKLVLPTDDEIVPADPVIRGALEGATADGQFNASVLVGTHNCASCLASKPAISAVVDHVEACQPAAAAVTARLAEMAEAAEPKTTPVAREEGTFNCATSLRDGCRHLSSRALSRQSTGGLSRTA